MPLVYSPEEDTFLMEEVIKEKFSPPNNLKILEIGCGSGYLLNVLTKQGIKKENITATDINPDALKKCREENFNTIKSDLFENIKGKFDIILFNPPYLPKDQREDTESALITTGGKLGSELINKFLKQAKNHLNKNGKIYLLTSSLTKNINFLKYKTQIVARKKFFFEELFVWELSV